jgi:MFS family permease
MRTPAGKLSDKIGRKPVIMGGMFLIIVAVASLSFSRSLLHMVPIAICFGIGLGTAAPAALALIADWASRAGKGLSMGLAQNLYQFGLAVGPSLMGLVAGVSDLNIMFLVCSASVAVALFIITGLWKSGNQEIAL